MIISGLLGGASAPLATVLFNTEETSNVTSSSYNQTHNINANANTVLLGIVIEGNGAARTASSITLAGESPSSQSTTETLGDLTLQWFTFPVGSTGLQTLAITGSGSMDSCSSVAYSLDLDDLIIRDAKHNSGTGGTVAASGLNNSIASLVAAYTTNNAIGPTISSYGVDVTSEEGTTGSHTSADHSYSSGYFNDPTAQTSVSYTWTGSNPVITSICAVG